MTVPALPSGTRVTGRELKNPARGSSSASPQPSEQVVCQPTNPHDSLSAPFQASAGKPVWLPYQLGIRCSCRGDGERGSRAGSRIDSSYAGLNG